MASTTPSLNPTLRVTVRNDLIQLHCENVSWDKATDKIPPEAASYLLGDLVQYLSTLVFPRGNRCLFMLEWPQVPESVEVWNYIQENHLDRMSEMDVHPNKCQYMLTHIGPLYPDLVEIYCHAHSGESDPHYREVDVWGIGKLKPQEHPEILYLPPSLPGSTPKKSNPFSTHARGNPPEIEDTKHEEFIGLVKKLLSERNQNLQPPKEHIPVGHVSMNQESFVQSSQAILQGLAEGGYIHTKTPKSEIFW